jgi:hypothetical protein
MDFSIESADMRVKRVIAPSFPDGQFEFDAVGQVCQNVMVVNDNLLEFDEQFYVDLTNVSPPGVLLPPLNSTAVVINDDEGT